MTEDKAKRLKSLHKLSKVIRDKEKRKPKTFDEFLHKTAEKPEFMLRDIFQLFHDMTHHYIPDGSDDYIKSEESIGFVHYDCSSLCADDCDDPFFADRLFANRFMNMVDGLRKGTRNKSIYLFEGPPGSGKSLFMNNILKKLEDYAHTKKGATYKVFWRLDVNKLGGFSEIGNVIPGVVDSITHKRENAQQNSSIAHRVRYPDEFLEFSCPNHDHPILMIPKSYRKKFLKGLIASRKFKARLFNEKQYEWVLKESPCYICQSLFNVLLDKLDDPLDVFKMIYVRENYFNRQLGECISVFNPGDQSINKIITNPTLQQLVNDLFKNDNVRIKFSYLAKTNNGVLALSDIKEKNIERLKNLHGIISDGVHKVELAEERVKTLFMGTINPSDMNEFSDIPSFRDRIVWVKIPYVLDYNTEVAIYKSKYGDKIEELFLPRVLHNFAKIVIASRLEKSSPTLDRWIKSVDKYKKYLDDNKFLLKMELYSGNVPEWLSEEDIKGFDRQTRKDIVEASKAEGEKGFSGRQSLIIFERFIDKQADSDKLITMDDLVKYFKGKNGELNKKIPEGFIESLNDMYDYNVLQEVKEASYYYNKLQLTRDIQNYLFSVNFEPGITKKCDYTDDFIDITEEYFDDFEAMFLGESSSPEQRKLFRKDTQKEYVQETLFREIQQEGKSLPETKQFKSLFEKYTRNLKENALTPYIGNDNYRRAIQDYGTKSFEAYEDKLKREVTLLIDSLAENFKYTQEGAKQISLYVLDKELFNKYK
jgi:predicted Ser/Thr protein kinase